MKLPWSPRAPLVAALLLLGSAGCSQAVGGGPAIPTLPTIVTPASPNALALANLTWLLHAIMLVVFLGVFAALLLLYRRYRATAPDQRGRRIYGHVKLEIAWITAPALVVLGVFLLSLNVMCTVDAVATNGMAGGGEPPRVVSVGRQWWWEYRLPEYGVVTANELHLPLGRPVVLELRADDVMHNWWVPQLAGKRYMIPGHVNELTFTPTQAGVFGGACGEFCGIQHAWMRIRVVVESPAEFAAWAANLAQPADPPRSALAQR